MLRRTKAKEKIIERDVLIIVGLMLVAIAIGVFILLHRRGAPPDVSQNLASAEQSAVASVPFTELTRGQKSSVTTRVNYLITSADELKKLWKMVDANPPPPTVDFKTHAVLAIFAGKEASASIAVAKIEDADTRLVSVTIANCAKSQSGTSPYEIVAVPVTTLPLAHEDLATTASCPN